MIKPLFQIYGILRWHKRTFPNATVKQQEQKLAEEIGEWSQAIDTVIATQSEADALHADEELIDVVIAAVNLMRYPEIQEAVNRKMAINRKRTWKDGHHKD